MELKHDKEIKKRIKEAGFAYEDFTDEELHQMDDEIECEQNGQHYIDGVLSTKPVYGRKK